MGNAGNFVTCSGLSNRKSDSNGVLGRPLSRLLRVRPEADLPRLLRQRHGQAELRVRRHGRDADHQGHQADLLRSAGHYRRHFGPMHGVQPHQLRGDPLLDVQGYGEALHNGEGLLNKRTYLGKGPFLMHLIARYIRKPDIGQHAAWFLCCLPIVLYLRMFQET